MRYVESSLTLLSNDLSQLKLINDKLIKSKFLFIESIILNNVSFKYPNNEEFALKNINIKIEAKSTVGIIGVSGSGKTTLVDLIAGLLTPQIGEVTVDSVKININNLRNWQKKIGYVSQHINLIDAILKIETVNFYIKGKKTFF